MPKSVSKKLIKFCEKKLLEIKEKHLTALLEMRNDLGPEEGADSGDLARRSQELQFSMAKSRKLSNELREIDEALHRIKEGAFGICEVTQEPIEESRLKIVPWARLSREGAEIQASEQELDQQMGAF